jgi:hypothetical protein
LKSNRQDRWALPDAADGCCWSTKNQQR